MHKKRIILLIFSLISLFLFIYFYKFNMEMNLTKENIDFINQDKGLNLIFKMPNMFDIYVRIITESSMKILIFIAPLIVTIPSLKNFYNIYKSGMIKTIVNTRKKYDIFMNNMIFNSYKSALILPCIFIYIIIVCCCYSKLSLTEPMLISNDAYFNSDLFFIFITIINLFLAGIFYINIGLIIINNFNNFYLLNIFIYILFLLISIFSELILGMGLYFITKVEVFGNIFSFFNIWFNGDCGNNLFVTLYLLTINTISIIFVKKKFKDIEIVALNV